MRQRIAVCFLSFILLPTPGVPALTISDSRVILPELPRVYVDTSHLPSVSLQVVVNAGDNLQAKLNAAAALDNVEVILDSAGSWSGNFVLPARTGAGWVWIHPSNLSAIPPPGTRIGPTQAGSIPKLISPNSSGALGNDNNNLSPAARLAHHYWITGLEITQSSSFNWSLMNFDASTDAGAVAADYPYMPHDIVIDRCFIHGIDDENVDTARGVRANAASFAVIDSYISDIHDKASGGEQQAIVAWATPGPLKVFNSYLESATENFMIGGNLSHFTGVTTSDIEFRHNYLAKKPKWWQTWTRKPPFKNLFELKVGVRALITDNLMEYSVAGGQGGIGITLTTRSQQSGLWTTVSDIALANNVVRHIGKGISLQKTDDMCTLGDACTQERRLLIQNNLFDDVNRTWGTPTGVLTVFAPSGFYELTVDRNTLVVADGQGSQAPLYAGRSACADSIGTNLNFTNNIFSGQMMADCVGDPASIFGAVQGYAISQNNIAVAQDAARQKNWADFDASTSLAADISSVGFSSDHFALSPTSPFAAKGAGANLACFDEAAIRNGTPSALCPTPLGGSAPPQPPSPPPSSGGPPNVNLSAIRVYPNPWRKDKHSKSQITFDGLTQNSNVKLFNVSGRQVKDLGKANSTVNWDLTNDAGKAVGSGVYLYLVVDDQGHKTRGKLAVIH